MFFKKDIYRALRPVKDGTPFGGKFKNISEIEYSDALIYPRFKFCFANKPIIQNGLFETSDYKKLYEIIGNRPLSVGSIFSYSGRNYVIKAISIDVLDIVIDYSNGHTNYYIGKPIPFHLEILISIEERNYWDITLEFTRKYSELKSKETLSVAENLELIITKSEAEKCFANLISQIADASISPAVSKDIYRAYGIFKSDCKEHKLAVDMFKKALEFDHINAELHFYIGYEYGLVNEDETALKYLKKAVELGSNEAQDYINENYR